MTITETLMTDQVNSEHYVNHGIDLQDSSKVKENSCFVKIN